MKRTYLATMVIVMAATVWGESGAQESLPQGMKAETGDARAFVTSNGLEEINSWVTDLVRIMSQGDAKKANELFLSKAFQEPTASATDFFLHICRQYSDYLVAAGLDDIELVACSRLSSKSLVLYYMVHTDQKPVLTIFHFIYLRNAWRNTAIASTTDWKQQVDDLAKASRFAHPYTIYPAREESVPNKAMDTDKK